jgi:hypothetical protein
MSLPRGQNQRFGKRLEREIYVASEPSATPPPNYAPINRNGRFGATFPRFGAFHRLGLAELRC